MNEYLEFKRKIGRRVEILQETIRKLETHQLVEKRVISRWREHLGQVEASLRESLLRVAVVGSVKSGKSTLINTLLGKDLLKRGAGIMTAFVTRIRTGGETGGWVELKPWAQVNDELNATLRMLPFSGEEVGEEEFLDIRRHEDRERLQALLEKSCTECRQKRGDLDPHFILLSGYLEGYKPLHQSVGEHVNRLIFDENTIERHRRYVGHEGQAVYTRDMELHVPVSWLGENVEIADCQGSDSPNPMHFALLQQYLLGSHFLLYIISGRTGLREADFKLLDFIKTLRMFPQTFFVLNVDLDAHPHREDLDRLVERVRKELAWVVPHPRLHAFSSLYHLMDSRSEALSERERRHLEIWKDETALVEFTEKGFSAFREQMGHRVSGQRARVLLGSGLSRLGMVAGGVLDTATAQKAFMDQGMGMLKKSAGQLRKRQKALNGTLATLENAISGLKNSLMHELDEAVDRYFDLESGPIVRETLQMVEHYPLDPRQEADFSDHRQLVRELHRFYLEFRQSLSRYIVEKVNLRVIEFAKEREDFLKERLAGASHSFWSVFFAALEDYRRDMARFNVELRTAADIRDCEWPSPEEITAPTFSAFLDGQAVGRGVLLIKFGLGRLTRFLSGLKTRMGTARELLQRESFENESIEEAISLVKSEARAEMIQTFKNYTKNFKHAYIFRLLDAGTRRLADEFRFRAEMTQFDFAALLEQSDVEGKGRQSMIEILSSTERITRAMVEELDELRCAVNLEWLQPEANPSEQAPRD